MRIFRGPRPPRRAGRVAGRDHAGMFSSAPGPLDSPPMDTMVADPLNGALLDGRYRIRGRIARGGVATVYHATDERLERTVAIKIIHADRALDTQFLRRFTDEAKTVARLTHPNVVAVYDQGTYQGLPYLVMEYVRGRTLREIINERRRPYPTEALAILEQVLAALAVAHRAGLVHRDVKPENILVAPPPGGGGDLTDAVVKVADFGLARAVERASYEQGGQLLATAEYVAPELVSDGVADSRADVYSAGIVLFEMLTGRVPFQGDRPVDVAWQHVDRDVPPPSTLVPGLPPILDDLVLRATRRDPAGRPTDAGIFLTEVQTARDDLGTLNRPAAIGAPTQVIAQPSAIAQPTVIVSQVDSRPPWSRLPAPRGTVVNTNTRSHHQHSGPPALAKARQTWDSALDRISRMRHTAKGRQQLTIAIVVLGLVLAVGGWWFGFGRYTDAPPLTSLTREAAVAEAQRLGFEIAVGPGIYDEKIAKDTVMRQQPAAGDRVARGGVITLTLSLGPERYAVPDVAGQAADFATNELKEHFLVQQVDGYSDTLPKGYVVGTDPAVGTPLKPGTTVKMIIAKGPYPVHVPAVVGKQLAEARAILEGQGFTVEVQQKDSDKARDEVLEQNPDSGTGMAAANGTKVTLVVSNGPPGTPMPSYIGQSCNDARNQLQGMGFQVSVEGQDFTWVREQSPNPGENVQPGQQVVLKCRFF